MIVIGGWEKAGGEVGAGQCLAGDRWMQVLGMGEGGRGRLIGKWVDKGWRYIGDRVTNKEA